MTLTKNEKQRPNIADILKMPFYKQIMQNFINSKGKTDDIIYKKTHTNKELQRMLDKMEETSKEFTSETLESQEFNF